MTDEPSISRRSLLRGGVAAAAVLAATACGAGSKKAAAEKPQATGRPTPSASTSPTPTAAPPPDPAAIKANELGLVPVMMYHRITPKITGEFDRTPADFKAELQRMFAKGYRPVRTIDLVRGEFAVKAGYTPVVLTFDDGYTDQFGFDPATGEVDPSTGLGILLEVCKQFEDCPPAGSFNINNNPFGLSDPAHQKAGLAKMHQLGFEIANHTFNHDNLGRLDATGIQKDFVQLQELVKTAVPDASVLTMALPFGVEPQNRELAHRGSWNGESYVNEGVLLVGANPSHSPFSKKFDAQQIPRIRSTSWDNGKMQMASGYWLDYLDAHPDQRYVAAGNPGKVTIPASWADGIAPAYAGRVVTY